MESVYRWKGAVHREPEILLLAKTTAACFDELEREVRALHTYDKPEIVAVPVTHVSIPYFEWITSNAFPPLVSRQAAESAAQSMSSPAPSASDEGQ
jgi:periplasmic divalent cation tolerance protein